jgi:hypothetical protein
MLAQGGLVPILERQSQRWRARHFLISSIPLDRGLGFTQCASHWPAKRMPFYGLRSLHQFEWSASRFLFRGASVRSERGERLSPLITNRSHAPVEVITKKARHRESQPSLLVANICTALPWRREKIDR